MVGEALDALGKRTLLVPGRANRAVHRIVHGVLPRSLAVRIMGRTMDARYGPSRRT